MHFVLILWMTARSGGAGMTSVRGYATEGDCNAAGESFQKQGDAFGWSGRYACIPAPVRRGKPIPPEEDKK
jgi:hypothetical protein